MGGPHHSRLERHAQTSFLFRYSDFVSAEGLHQNLMYIKHSRFQGTFTEDVKGHRISLLPRGKWPPELPQPSTFESREKI